MGRRRAEVASGLGQRQLLEQPPVQQVRGGVGRRGGVAPGRIAGGGRMGRGINLVLALVLAAPVALIWT